MGRFDFSDKNILVTGGTGFIGGRLVERLVLECNANVRVLVRDFSKAARIARFPIEMIKGDVTSLNDVSKATEGCDYVFHCAYGNSNKEEIQRQVNVEGTRNIMAASLKNGVKRVVHISTVLVYGDVSDEQLTEDCPRRYSGNVYADTKLEAEKVTMEFSKNGLGVIIIQPTVVYGPNAPVFTVGVLSQLKKNRLVIGDGEGLCNAVYVDDAVNALLLSLVEEKAKGEVFLISGESPVKWRDFFRFYENMLGVNSIVCMSDAELNKYRKQLQRSNNTINKIRRALRNPKRRAKLLSIPVIAKGYNFIHSTCPRFIWRKIKEQIIRGDIPNNLTFKDNLDERPLLIPDEFILDIYRERIHVQIDKAKRLLNYHPLFNLEKGMSLTQKWAKWANLL